MKLNFGGVIENVVTRQEFPLEKAREVLKYEVVATLGYGIQGRGQSLNMRDNGVNVIVGQRQYESPGQLSKSWQAALVDGWIPGENLFSLEEATKRATIKQYLLTDAAQVEFWRTLEPTLKEGDGLDFAHAFGIGYANQTGIVPPKNVDVIGVFPKGAGRTVRDNFLAGSGINSSYAVYQNYTGRAVDRVKALGITIGSGYLFETTFENEVHSDHLGERAVLLGATAAIMKAQYDILRKKGHSPSEAFNETVEEATQSLIPLIGKNGMDWMFSNCSETARIGALRWLPRFERAVIPVLEELYDSIVSGEEVRIVLERSRKPDYRDGLAEELKDMGNSEMWRAGAVVRSLRPENWKKEQ